MNNRRAMSVFPYPYGIIIMDIEMPKFLSIFLIGIETHDINKTSILFVYFGFEILNKKKYFHILARLWRKSFLFFPQTNKYIVLILFKIEVICTRTFR